MLKETNTPTRPRIEPGSPDPESDALAIRPVRPPLYDLMDYTNHKDLPGLLLLINFEKAFDSVSWEFMFKILDFYNFGKFFRIL